MSEIQKRQIRDLLSSYNFLGNLTIYSNNKNIWTYTTDNISNTAYLINSVQKTLTAGLVINEVKAGGLKFR